MSFFIVNYKCEHSAEHRSNFFSVGLVSLKNNFCVGVCPELTSVFLNQFFTDLLIVVNFSVKNNDMFAICTVNRLRSAFKVDDTQTAEAKGYIVINKASLAVRSAVGNAFTHLVDDFFSIKIAGAIIACKSTHKLHILSELIHIKNIIVT